MFKVKNIFCIIILFSYSSTTL